MLSDVFVTGTGSVRVVRFKLRDSTSDRVRLEPTFQVTGEAERVLAPLDPATIVGLQTTPNDQEFAFIWDTGDPTQIGARRVDVVVRLVAVDAGGLRTSPPEESPTFTVDNDRPTQALVTPPARATNGTVSISYVLVDPEEQLEAIEATFEIEGVPPGPGTSGIATSAGGDGKTGLATSAQGTAHIFVWGYSDDLDNMNAATRVRFTIAPQSAGGIAGAVSLLVGNDAPQAAIQSPADGAMVGGAVTIEYTLFDTTADPAAIVAEFSTTGPGGPFLACASASPVIGLATQDPMNPGQPALQTFVWQSAANIAGNATATFRITPTDGLAGSPGAPVGRTFEVSNAAALAPELTAVTPAAGPAAGGTPVTIVGQNFAGATTVTFDGAALVDPLFQGSSAITGTTPPGMVGPVDVVVTTPGFPPVTRGDLFAYRDPPTIATLVPQDGPVAGGTPVTITGTGFDPAPGATTVTLGGQALAGTATISMDGTTITGLSTPGALVAGAVPLVVTTAAGQATRAAAFRYLAVPDAMAIAPDKGPLAGRAVTITGTAFASSDTQVLVDGSPLAPAAFTVQGDTTIAATLPSRPSAGAVDLVVTTPGGTDPTPVSFTYLDAPTLAASPIAPAEGALAGLEPVTITGTGFIDGETTVTLGGLPLGALMVEDAMTITGTTPPGAAAGPADLVVTTPGGTATRAGAFTYLAPLTIALVIPGEGPTTGGTLVSIAGTGFRTGMGATTATIDGNPLTDIQVQSTQLLTGRTPPGTPGAKTVAVATATEGPVPLANGFTYRDTPILTAIDPVDGPLGGGTTITIAGDFFTADAIVTIGGVTAPTTFFDAQTLTAMTPARGSPATVTVTVTTPSGQASLANAFTYLDAPNATAIAPAEGPLAGAIDVTITGTAFQASALPTVTVGGEPLADVAVPNATTITGTLPAAPGGAGFVDVVVTTRGGPDPTPVPFEYVAAPTIASIAPSTGPTLGNTSVTIAGTGFRTAPGATTVTIGGVPLVDLNVADEMTITGRTPASPGLATGARDVVVTTAGGTATLAGGFTYADALTVTAISPNRGTPKGGTLVAISGSGFTGVTSVTIGGQPASDVSVVNGGAIVARTPPGTIGNPPAPRPVVVTLASGAQATRANAFGYRPTLTFNAVTSLVLEDASLVTGVSTLGQARVDVVLELDPFPLTTFIDYNVTDTLTGSATAGSDPGVGDYNILLPTAGSFTPGTLDGARGTVMVQARPDGRVEGDEDVRLSLGITMGDAIIGAIGTHRVIIRDDEVRFTSFAADRTRAQIGTFGPASVLLSWAFLGSPFHPIRVDRNGLFLTSTSNGSTVVQDAPFSPSDGLIHVVDPRAEYKVSEGDLDYGPGFLVTPADRLEVDVARHLGSASPGGAGGAAAVERVRGIAAFPDGTVVVAGEFEGTLALAGSAGGPLISAGDSDIFLVRYAPTSGDILWATRAGGPGRDAGRAVAVQPGGRVVLVSECSADAFFPPLATTTSSGARLNVAFFDGGNGDCLGFYEADGADVLGEAVSVFVDGSFAVTGRFSGTASFPRVPGGIGAVPLDSDSGSEDVFVARFRRDATLDWARRAGGAGPDAGLDVAALPDGEVVVVGSFDNPATFGSTTLDGGPMSGKNGFVARYDAAGALLFAGMAAGAGEDEATSVSVLPGRRWVVAGTFDSNVLTVNQSDGTSALFFRSSGGPQLFLVEYRVFGQTGQAVVVGSVVVTTGGGTATVRAADVTVLPGGTVAVVGTFSASTPGETVTFGELPPNRFDLVADIEPQIFLATFDGVLPIGVLGAGGPGDDQVRGLAALPDGGVAIAGEYFSNPATFGENDPATALDDDPNRTHLFPANPAEPGDLFYAHYRGMNYRTLTVRPSGLAFASSVVGGTSAADPATSRVNGIAAFPDGGFAVTGTVDGDEVFFGAPVPGFGAAAGGSDQFVIRYDVRGSPLWAATIDRGGSETGLAAASFLDGSVIVTGGEDRIYFRKYGADGMPLFQGEQTGGPGEARGTAVEALPDGTAVIVGHLQTAPDVRLIRFRVSATTNDVIGAVTTLATIPQTGSIEARAISVRGDGSGYATGVYRNGAATFGSGAGAVTLPAADADGDAFLCRFDPDGNVLDARRVTGAAGLDEGRGVLALEDGGAIVAGTFSGTLDVGSGAPIPSAGGRDVFIVRYDDAGMIAYARTASGAMDVDALAFAAHTDESFVITGLFRQSLTLDAAAPNGTLNALLGSTTADGFIARYRANGDFLSALVVATGPTDIDEPLAAAILPDRSAVVGGRIATGTAFGLGTVNPIFVPAFGSLANALPHLFVARFFPDED